MRWLNPCVLRSTAIPNFPTKCTCTFSKPSVTVQVWDFFVTDIDGRAVNTDGCGPKLTMDATIAAAYMTYMAI